VRDHCLHPAQTNLELYAQAIARGWPDAELERLGRAYLFALRPVRSLARGSGKPFIAHLVGTASLVMESGCPYDWVIAALLHALYQRRVPFQGGLSPEARRDVLKARFGPAVEDLVHRYTVCESADLATAAAASEAGQDDVLTLRLADELEDITGHALALHGDIRADALGTRGSHRWRSDAKTAEAPALLALTRRLGLDGIERGLRLWLDFASAPVQLTQLRTGWLSSVDLTDDASEPGA
jgi:hypothetical protein